MVRLKDILQNRQVISAATFGLRISNAAIGLLVAFFVVRKAGSEIFGLYSVFMAIISVVGASAAWGLPQYITRELAAERLNAAADISLVRTSFAVFVCGAFLSSVGCLSYLWFIMELKSFAPVLIASLALGISLCVEGAIRGLGGLLIGQLSELLIRPVAFLALLAVGGSIWGYTLETVVATAAASFVISALAAIALLLSKTWITPLPRSKGSVTSSKLRSIFIIGLSSWLDTIAVQMPLLMIGWLATHDQAASFRIAFYLVPLYTIALKSINVHDYYEYSIAYRQTKVIDIISVYKRSKIYTVVYYTLITIPAIFILPHMIPILVDEKVAVGSDVIITLCLGILITAPFGSINVRLLAGNMEGTLIISQLVGIAASGALGLALIPKVGALGAALAYVAGYSASKFSMAIILPHREWRTFNDKN